ncbi:MAG: SBBP repeat-containing protein [Ignavibacteriae bacterium]|nr:SBBP repeat-containing protein [Ignavibacteriota bacterium]
MKKLSYSLRSLFYQSTRLVHFILLLAIIAGVTDVCYSQVSERWARRNNGPGEGHDGIQASAVDNAGNIYGTGSYTVSGPYDYGTVKYDASGNQLWLKTYNGPGNGYDPSSSIAVDNSGNVYISGYSQGVGTMYDFATIKYDAAGNELWVKRYHGGNDYGLSLAIDNSGNVYVTGTNGSDYITIKYDAAGNELWLRAYDGGSGWDEARCVVVDNSGNVYVGGRSRGIGGFDYATVKYDAAGNQLWASRYNGPANGSDEIRKLAVDNAGNVFVTGQSAGSGTGDDYATVKYGAAGNELWAKRFNGPGNREDIPLGIIVDNSGNCHITGVCASTGGSLDYDYATIKYDAAGNELWIKRYNGPANNNDGASLLVLDDDGNVYITGSSVGTGTGADFATVKYDAAGNEKWAIRYNNSTVNGDDYGNTLSLDPYGNVIVCGVSMGATSNDFYTIKYSQDENTRTFVDLVKIYGPGNCKATFGYKFDHDENIPVGADNKFIPAPENRGQTTSFTAGTHHDLFEVPFSTPLTWHVKSGAVTTEATAEEKHIYCEADDHRTTMPNLNQETEYEIKYKKTGGGADVFTNIELYNTIPDGTEFVSATSSAKMTAVSLTGNTYKWTRTDPIGPADEEDMVKIKVKVTDATRPDYTNTAVLKTICSGTNYNSYGSDVNAMPPPLPPNQWTQYPTGVPYSLFAVDFYKNDLTPAGNDMVGLAVGQGGTVLRTTDAGWEWTLVYQNINIWLNDVKWSTANVAYAAGMGGVIIKTVDAGATWTVIRAYDTPMHTFRGIAVSQAYDYNFVTFVGYAGTYFETHDAGTTFIQRTDVTPWTMHSIDYVYVSSTNDLNGIIAGTDGYVWNTANHGVNWVVRPELRNSGVYDYLNDVVFASKEIAFICGNNGRIVLTTNHGITWIVKPSFTSQHLRSIDMIKTGPPSYDHRTVTVCGDNGLIYTSLDWCNTWTNGSPAGETRHFYGVCLNGEHRGTVVGEIGTGVGNVGMMYNSMSNGMVSVNQIGTTVPSVFTLNQNFPNPFNPTTKISFSLAKSGPVLLTVFDMTGKEVVTLVNTVLSAGNFEYEFDGSKLSSGIYFYRIVTNDFVEAKKMSLIK